MDTKYYKQKHTLGAVIGFIAAIILVYILLLGSQVFSADLQSLLRWMLHLSHAMQFLAIALIPPCLLSCIFLSGMVGAGTGTWIQKRWRKLSRS